MSRPESFENQVQASSSQDAASAFHDEAYARPTKLIAQAYTDTPAPTPEPTTHPSDNSSTTNNNNTSAEAQARAAAAARASADQNQNQNQRQSQDQSQKIDRSGNSNIKDAGNSNVRDAGNSNVRDAGNATVNQRSDSFTFVAPSAPTVIPGEGTLSSTYYNTGNQVLNITGRAANSTDSGAFGIAAPGVGGLSFSFGHGGPDGKATDLTVLPAVEIQRDAAGTFFGRQSQIDGVAPAAGARLQETIVQDNLARRTKPKPAEQ